MDKLKFNSQVCTTIEQSKKLLELGLKPDTADMNHFFINRKWVIQPGYCKLSHITFPQDYIPAWSLHRLMELNSANVMEGYIVILNYDNTYDNIIEDVEETINNGYFNKEYLNK